MLLLINIAFFLFFFGSVLYTLIAKEKFYFFNKRDLTLPRFALVASALLLSGWIVAVGVFMSSKMLYEGVTQVVLTVAWWFS